LPDISTWKLNEKVLKRLMFFHCDKKIIPEKFMK